MVVKLLLVPFIDTGIPLPCCYYSNDEKYKSFAGKTLFYSNPKG
jgi:hypothetical protein